MGFPPLWLSEFPLQRLRVPNPTHRKATPSMSPPIKPPTDNIPRSFRGGSWINATVTNVRAAYRDDVAPMLRDFHFGFRTTQKLTLHTTKVRF